MSARFALSVSVATGILGVALGAIVAGCDTRRTPPLSQTDQPRSTSSPGGFKEVAKEVGIDFRHDNGGFGKKLFPEIMGSGGAFIDADGDGYLDLILLNCRTLEGAPKARDFGARFYHNRGNGTFEDWTERSGLKSLGFAMGAAVGDYDGDGAPDLYITALYGDRLFRNVGGAKFQDVTRSSGLKNRAFSSSAAFLDYDNDGDQDLYVCNYVKLPQPIDRIVCRNPARGLQYCDVHIFDGEGDRLYENRGDSTFRDVSRAAGIDRHSYRGLAVLCSDYDRDGRIDLFVANDEHPMLLWHNLGGGRFENVAGEAGIAVDGRGKMVAGMGLDLADLDRNGQPELYESSFEGEPNVLFEMKDGNWFVDATHEWNLATITERYLTFGVGFLDFDQDGWRDLLIANGHVIDDVERFQPGVFYGQPAQLFRNEGNRRLTEASERLGDYFGVRRVGRGLLMADYDNDGDPDALITNNNGAPALLKNLYRESGGSNNWLGVRCLDTSGKRDVSGARVTIRSGAHTDWAETRTAAGYLGSNDPRVLFGLGTLNKVEHIEIAWPGGILEEYEPSTVNHYLTVRQGSGRPITQAR